MSDSQDGERAERREAEVALLQAMYPTEITWHEKRQEITYKPEAGGSLTLRVLGGYPGDVQPEIISALDRNKDDVRNSLRHRLDALDLPIGEEVIDAIVQAFSDVVSQPQEEDDTLSASARNDKAAAETKGYKTVVVWLHHLLNTNKRKLALNPSVDMLKVAGATKPGYPGILVYTGDAAAIDAHVSELKAQRWQAFQIRYEEVEDTPWLFSHGSSIKEMESMSEVTQSILSDDSRNAFLQAVGIK